MLKFKSYFILFIFYILFSLTYAQYTLPSLPNCSSISIDSCDLYAGCTTTNCEGILNITALDLCGSFTRLQSCQAAGCQWNGCIGNFIYPSSCSSVTDSLSCYMTNGCTYDQANQICTGKFETAQTCFDFFSQQTCRTGVGCQWMGNLCIGDFKGYHTCNQYSFYECPSGFGCGSSCVFNPTIFCGSISHALDCYTVDGCYWNGAYCSGNLAVKQNKLCNTYSNATCNNWPGCSIVEKKSCKNKACPDILEYNACISRGCYWLFSMCVIQSPSSDSMSKK